MRARNWLVVGALFGATVACTDAEQEVERAREKLQETQNDAIKKVDEAQMRAAKDVNRVKEEMAEEIEEAREDLTKAQERAARLEQRRDEGSSSGSTSSAGLMSESRKYSHEFCEELAQSKTIVVDQKEAYEACAELKQRK